jgi:lysozyme
MILATYLVLLTLCPGWQVVANETDMTISPEGIEFIKSKEKLKLETYDDGTGVQTIGYGHTGKSSGTPVQPGTVISEAEADQLLLDDLEEHQLRVNNRMNNFGVKLDQKAFDYMVIATFNRGSEISKKAMYTAAANKDYETLAVLMLDSISGSDKNVKEGLTIRVNDELKYLQTEPPTPTTTSTTTTTPSTTTTTVPSVQDTGTPLEDERRRKQREALAKKTFIEDDVDEVFKSFETIIKQFFGIIPGGPKPQGKYGLLGDKISEMIKKD